MTKEQQDGPDVDRIPLNLLRRVDKYLQDHPDEELIPLESAETMEPITITKEVSTVVTDDIEIDWFRYS